VIGEGTNIQDNTMIHTDHGIPTILGRWISVGHSAILHGCRVADHCLIGMGSILLNNVVVEEECLVAAGALLSPGFRAPKGHMVMGVPGRALRALRPDEIQHVYKNAENYVGYMEKHIHTSKAVHRP
jgi:carbonic anhydrase/acetyltransferase-like protein (isoleucine patch superfamily)